MPRRQKLAPDPDVRRAIVAAASKSVREQGVRGLNVATVLERARLSPRAFYRHFDSKDQLVAAVYVEIIRAEARRAQRGARNDSMSAPSMPGWPQPECRSCGIQQHSPGAWSRCGSRTPTASGSSWSRFLLITLSGVIRDRRYHRDDEPHAV